MNDNDLTPLSALLSHRQEPDKDLNDLARAVVGAGIEVHRHLGPGVGEFFYETAFKLELELRKIPYTSQDWGLGKLQRTSAGQAKDRFGC